MLDAVLTRLPKQEIIVGSYQIQSYLRYSVIWKTYKSCTLSTASASNLFSYIYITTYNAGEVSSTPLLMAGTLPFAVLISHTKPFAVLPRDINQY